MDFFSKAKVDALRRLKDAFEQKLLDEDEYKAEKAKVLNATAAAAPAEDDFELVGVQTPAERAAESRRRAEAEGNVVEIDDDEPAAPAPAPRRNPRRGEERVVIRCRHVYFGTAVRRDVTVVFAPSGVTMEWRSDERGLSGLYFQVRLEPSNMLTFDMYHRSHNVRADDDAIDPTAPDAIQDFVAIGLRQAPRHLGSIEGFEPNEENARKYIVIELEGDALLTFKREAVPAVVWGGHLGWPAAPVLGSVAAARPFLKGVEYADALRRSAAGEFVVPPVIQSYKRRAPDDDAAPAAPPVRPRLGKKKDIVPLTTAEKAAVLHAIAQLDGKATQKKVRRAAESALGQPKGFLDAKKKAITDVCREEVARLEKAEESRLAEESRKRQRPPDADDDVVVTGSVNAIDAVAARIAAAEKSGDVIEIGDDSPKKAATAADDDAFWAAAAEATAQAEREAGLPAPAPAPAPIPVAPPPQLWAPVPVAPPLAPPLAPPPVGRSCTCGVPAVRRTAQTDRNFGRVFYACRYGRDAGCGYFDWEDGGGVGGVDMRRVQLLATLHARGALSDADYAQAMALEFRALR